MKKLLIANTAGGQRRVAEVFRDFCELSALWLRNPVDPDPTGERQRRYNELVDRYTEEERQRFTQLFHAVTDALQSNPTDVLGELFMSLDLGNDHTGQFFTPFSVSEVMAQITIDSVIRELDDKPFVTVSEPTVGAGGMVIALATTLRSRGINYQQRIHVTAQDIDITAVHMAYIQMSLMYIPGVVIHGNTLTLESRDTWPTIAHARDAWASRLALRELFEPSDLRPSTESEIQ